MEEHQQSVRVGVVLLSKVLRVYAAAWEQGIEMEHSVQNSHKTLTAMLKAATHDAMHKVRPQSHRACYRPSQALGGRVTDIPCRSKAHTASLPSRRDGQRWRLP